MTVREFLNSGINYNSDTLVVLFRGEDEIEFNENLKVVGYEYSFNGNTIYVEVE